MTPRNNKLVLEDYVDQDCVVQPKHGRRVWNEYEVGYLPKVLVCASLPYRSPPDDIDSWLRSYRGTTLSIASGYQQSQQCSTHRGSATDSLLGPIRLGLPYGSIPRLCILWLASQAVLQGSPEVEIGHSLAGVMEAMGIARSTGGQFGSVPRFKEQIQRLLGAQFSVDRPKSSFRGTRQTTSFRLVDGDVHLSSHLRRGRIVLTHEFYYEVVRHPVAIRYSSFLALMPSCLAMDIYCWLTWKMNELQQPAFVTWDELARQFGSQAEVLAKFRERFRGSLRKVLTLNPEAKVEYHRPSELLLFPCPGWGKPLPNQK